MSGHGSSRLTSFLLIISVVFLAGCEQLTALKDQLSAKIAKKGTSSQPAVAKAAPAAMSQPSTKAPEPKSSEMAPDTLAKIGDWSLTIGDFNERLQGLQEVYPQGIDINNINLKLSILEELIRQQLLVLDAQKSGVADRKDIAAAIEEFKRTILVREMIAELTEAVGEVTEEEAKQYYEENKESIVDDPQWRVREIVTTSKDDAKNILSQIYQGTDFTTLAKEQSTAASKDKGGDLGVINFGNLPFPEMGNALLPLEAGDVSSVFQGPNGFYIVKVEEKTGGQQRAFADVKDDIIAGLTINKQQEILLQHVNKLWDENDVTVNEKLLEARIDVKRDSQ